MEEPLVSFDVASLLKEKGFDWKTFNYFNSERDLVTPDEYEVEFYPHNPINHNLQDYNWSRPSQLLAQKWLREVHSIHVNPRLQAFPNKYYIEIAKFGDNIKFIKDKETNMGFESYEKALEVGLLEALKLINNN